MFRPVPLDPVNQAWRWRAYPELNGLGVRCIGEGKGGVIWFGTAAGTVSYDGFEFRSFGKTNGLPGGVDEICSGGESLLYACGSWGIAWQTGSWWNPIWPLHKAGEPFPKTLPALRRMASGRDGSLWAATSWGILRQKGRDWVLYTDAQGASAMQANPSYPAVRVETFPEAIINAPKIDRGSAERFDFCDVRVDRDGRVWLGTEAGEILCLKPANSYGTGIPAGPGGDWTLFNESKGLSRGSNPRILELPDGKILAISTRAGNDDASTFDGAVWHSQTASELGLPDESHSLLATRDGAAWLGGNGTLSANRNGRWQVYRPSSIPIPNSPLSLFQSSDGALWVAGQDAEILRLDYQTARWTGYQDLNFQWQGSQGDQWFLHRDGRVVVQRGGQWASYNAADGVIDAPTSLIGTREGDIWVAGSHQRTAATARFDGTNWVRTILTNLSWAVDSRCLFQSADGTIWFGAASEPVRAATNYEYGLRAYRDGKWSTHTVRAFTNVPSTNGSNLVVYADPAISPVGKYHALGESRDGKMWTLDVSLSYFTGRSAGALPFEQSRQIGAIDSLFTSRERDLWVGTHQFGVFRFNGATWTNFGANEGLLGNSIRSLTQSSDGTIWAATDRSTCRFDGQAWTSDVLPSGVNLPRGGSLRAGIGGAIWLNRSTTNWTRRAWPLASPTASLNGEFSTICYQPSQAPPQTHLTFAATQVPQPGNISISWQAADPWRNTPDGRLQYSYRMDLGPWSRFSPEKHQVFLGLPSGSHHFEVRARNDDFLMDPHPASVEFEVLPPVWKQAWFRALLTISLGIIVLQTVRIISWSHRLRRANRALAAEVEERKRAQERAAEMQRQLLAASRQAGMAEVAANVLHNVGNVLNSVNVSATVLTERMKVSPAKGLPKLAGLLAEHAHEPNFLAQHEKGRHVPDYLKELGGTLETQREESLRELSSLQSNINHIKEIVARQEALSRGGAFSEPIKLSALINDAIAANADLLKHRQIQVVRTMVTDPILVLENAKAGRLLSQLIRHAAESFPTTPESPPRIGLRALPIDTGHIRIEIEDNGSGLRPEDLTGIFQQKFDPTTSGREYSLHDAANAATELGGRLSAASAGPGRGTTFSLDLPLAHPENSLAQV